MEEPYKLQSSIKGKDLPGAIKVMPMGLDAAIKKRVSGEFRSEQRGSSTTFSHMGSDKTAINSQTFDTSSDVFQQKMSSKAVSSQKMTSSSVESQKIMSSHKAPPSLSESNMIGSVSSQKMTSAESQKIISSQSLSDSTNMIGSVSSQKTTSTNISEFSSSFKSQQDFQTLHEENISNNQQEIHGVEIKQENLKTQIHSAITDLEKEIGSDFDNKENVCTQIKSPTPAKPDIFSPPPLERMEPPKPAAPQFETPGLPQFDTPSLLNDTPSLLFDTPSQLKESPSLLNGHANSIEIKQTSKSEELQQIEEHTTMQSSQMNGSYQESSFAESNSDSLLKKIMTPASNDYDSSSLKRRDPRKMFTDSSFYSAKHHPTVADQVEMAHRLSSALFQEDNKMSKGQQMYLNRAKRSGDNLDDLEVAAPRHDKVPNLKLVMNPEGKVHEWSDVAPEDKAELAQIAGHAAAMAANIPNTNTDSVAGKGGELFAKRRKKAEHWVVDENSVGQSKPSNFADKYMQQQQFQQQQFQQQQQLEQQQKQQIEQQNLEQQQSEVSRQQQEYKQQFQQQQQLKQEQSLEIRRQQEEQIKMNSSQPLDLPDNFQHYSLKGRSFTPMFDTSCHNVQGINVWANTAPRGWAAGTTQRVPGKAPPVVEVCPATPSAESQLEEARQQEQKQQELALRQKQEEEALLLQKQQQEALLLQKQQEEALFIQQQQEEALLLRKQQEEALLIQKQQEEAFLLQQQQEETLRIQKQQEEALMLQKQKEKEEAMLIKKQQEEAEKIRLEKEAQLKAENERMELEAQRQQQLALQQQQEAMQQQALMQQQQAVLQQQQQAVLQQQQQAVLQQQQQAVMQQQAIVQQQSTSMSSQVSSTKTVHKSGGLSSDVASPLPSLEPQLAKPPVTPTSHSHHKMTEQHSQTRDFSAESSSVSQMQTSSSSKSLQQSFVSREEQRGVIRGPEYKVEQQVEDYTSSLHPTTTGDIIRQGGDVVYSHARSESQEGRSPLRQTPAGQDIRDTGVFGGIKGDQNCLVEDDGTIDYTKHTVRDLVGHFSKVKTVTEIPDKYLPQQHQYTGVKAPSFSYLHQTSQEDKVEVRRQDKTQVQARQSQMEVETAQSSAQFSAQSTSKTEQTESKKKEETKVVTQRRQSLKDYLLMDPATDHMKAGFIDPSAILRDPDEALGGARSAGVLRQSALQGSSENLTEKWDNHNAIARGWAGVKANYHPVTFREIYNVESQANTHNL